MLKKLLLIPFISLGQNQLEDSLISLSDRLPDTSFTCSYKWDNYRYDYRITNEYRKATFELLGKEKLYTDWRKIGGMFYFFGTWSLMIGHDYIKKDKVKHFVAGYGISVGSYLLTKSIVKSNLIAIFTGVLKEVVWDGYLKKGTPSYKDALWTGVGGFYGSITIPMIKTKPCKPLKID